MANTHIEKQNFTVKLQDFRVPNHHFPSRMLINSSAIYISHLSRAGHVDDIPISTWRGETNSSHEMLKNEVMMANECLAWDPGASNPGWFASTKPKIDSSSTKKSVSPRIIGPQKYFNKLDLTFGAIFSGCFWDVFRKTFLIFNPKRCFVFFLKGAPLTLKNHA